MIGQVDALAGTLRIIIAIMIAGVAIYLGFDHRSPWIVMVFAPVFTALYALGKWRAWAPLVRNRRVGQLLAAIAVTLPVQAIVFGVLYLIGLGLGRLFSDGDIAVTVTRADWIAAVALLGIAGAATGVIIWRERADIHPHPIAGPTRDAPDSGRAFDPEPIELDPTPLTVETFFLEPHHTHKREEDEPEDALPRAARSTPEMIAEAEARLGVSFPSLLRTLYERQNGGYVGWMYVPVCADPQPNDDDWRGAFAIDYSDLSPLEGLRTLYDCYLDFTDPDYPDQAATIPEHAKRYVVLAQRYQDTTYLDYSQPGPPRVGIADFDISHAPDVTFEDFETFFAALRRDAEQ